MSREDTAALGKLYFYDDADKSITDGGGRGLILEKADEKRFFQALDRIIASGKPSVFYTDIHAREDGGDFNGYQAGVIYLTTGEKIVITLQKSEKTSEKDIAIDKLTGLLNRSAFAEWIRDILEKGCEQAQEKYMVVYFDVQRFKTVNDMLGMNEGDRLLKHIAGIIEKAVEGKGAACRIGSDRFAFITKCETEKMSGLVENLFEKISEMDLSFEITCNAGIYIIEDRSLPAESIIDRAIMAQSPIKGSYTKRYNFYTEELREKLLTEQEITGMMRAALKGEQFVIHYQPQYNHSTGMLVGAEALVRWYHPEKGLIPPNRFIPVFEKNGFITKLDMYVFEKVCIFLRKCMDKNLPVVPVSTNLTRYDIFAPNFIEMLEETRRKYEVPSKYIRVEITESAALGNSQFINAAVKKLHSYGYIVEMDDFGSGYSSLNILLETPFDVIKLDKKFMENMMVSAKGRMILEQVVSMANRLGLGLLAEGVETKEQVELLQNIGCDQVQGYYYAKPMAAEDFFTLLKKQNQNK